MQLAPPAPSWLGHGERLPDRGRAGVTVIDAGLPGQWDEFTHELAEMGRSLEDVRGLILTHGDTDHLGFAERLREHGVSVYCTRPMPRKQPARRRRTLRGAG